MEGLREKANNYAEENVNNVLKEAFAKVYADGYREGFIDCKNEKNIDLRMNQTIFVDLGLPSGTLWADDYEKSENDDLFTPYELASIKAIPTKAQWLELKKYARWEFVEEKGIFKFVRCIGPNGNMILFYPIGGIDFAKKVRHDRVLFWIKDETKSNCAVDLWMYNHEGHQYADRDGEDLKLPLRLVRAK